MAPNSFERTQESQIGVRGPFDPYDTEESTLKMADEFLRRTGLIDYAQYIRVGASLAKRSFGSAPQGRADYQVDFLKRFHEKEDAELEDSTAHSPEISGTGLQGAKIESIDTKENRDRRREYEYDMLDREGNKRKWQIYRRQSWRVHALVLCCSLGAAIQGWDESAVNGGDLRCPAA